VSAKGWRTKQKLNARESKSGRSMLRWPFGKSNSMSEFNWDILFDLPPHPLQYLSSPKVDNK
jgi:hypothetical protein